MLPLTSVSQLSAGPAPEVVGTSSSQDTQLRVVKYPVVSGPQCWKLWCADVEDIGFCRDYPHIAPLEYWERLNELKQPLNDVESLPVHYTQQMLTFSSDWRNFQHFNPVLLFCLQLLLLPCHIIHIEGFILHLIFSWAILMVMGCPGELGGIWYMHKGYTHASALQGWHINNPSRNKRNFS